MKKYFLMLATMAAALFVSCEENNPGPTPPPTPPAGTTVLNEAVYYGEQLGKDVGYYSMTFTNGDNKLRLDIFSGVASDADNAKPVAGQYELGTQDKPATKTFFLAKDSNAKQGTLYWDNGTPMLVTGGEVTLQLAPGGGFRAAIKLQAGETEIDWDFNGSKVTFINEYVSPPRLPVTVGGFIVAHIGEYALSTTPMDLLAIQLESADENDMRIIVFHMPVPVQDDKEKIEIPTGTFQIVKDPQEPYQIAAGYPEGRLLLNSRETEFNKDGSVKQYNAIEEGTVTITRNGEKIGIEANVNGSRINSQNVAAEKINNIVYTLEPIEAPLYAEDFTTPKSTLTADKALENFTNAHIDGYTLESATGPMAFYRFVFATEGVTLIESPNYAVDKALRINGEGEIMSIQFMAPSSSPSGTFQMAATYEDYSISPKVMPGMLGIGDLLAFMDGGTNYVEIGTVDGQPHVINNAGAAAGKGFVTVLQEEKSLTVEVELYDKYDHKISGTIIFEAPAAQAANRIKAMNTTKPVVNLAPNVNRYAPVQVIR